MRGITEGRFWGEPGLNKRFLVADRAEAGRLCICSGSPHAVWFRYASTVRLKEYGGGTEDQFLARVFSRMDPPRDIRQFVLSRPWRLMVGLRPSAKSRFDRTNYLAPTDIGLTLSDGTHRGVLDEAVELPHGVKFTTTMQAESGPSCHLLNGADAGASHASKPARPPEPAWRPDSTRLSSSGMSASSRRSGPRSRVR